MQPRFRRRGELHWSSKLAYATGLVATDGFLTTRNVVGFSSTDLELVEKFLQCIDRPIRYQTMEPERQKGNASLRIRPRKTLYIAQCPDPLLYDWFLQAGITPRKSLSLGPVEVPCDYFFDLVRGLLDGDGSVMSLNSGTLRHCKRIPSTSPPTRFLFGQPRSTWNGYMRRWPNRASKVRFMRRGAKDTLFTT
jgi:hypothetical protein